MVELETQRVFRRGENERKPYLGNPSGDPFTLELHRLTASKGFVSQLALARALVGQELANKKQGTISNWFTGKYCPLPGDFISLIKVLEPDEEELMDFVAKYTSRTGRTINLENLRE